ncbi:MAG: tetratricopeptide repeat protein [Rhodospirillales bacterium]
MSTDRNRLATQLQEAVAHHRAGRLNDAERLYKRVLQTAPDQPDALRLMAGIALQTGRHSVAEGFAKRALAQRPDNAELHRMLATALLERGKADAAAESAKRALELATDSTPARLLLGNALHAAGDFAGAEREWRLILAAAPNDVPTQYNLAQLLLKSGRNAEAATLLENAVAKAPTHAGALALLGQSTVAENPSLAAGLLQRAVELGHRSVQTYVALGDALLESKNRFKAREAFDEALRLDPRNIPALTGLAHILMILEQSERALELLRRAASIEPANEAVKAALLDALDLLWRLDEAVVVAGGRALQDTDFGSWLCRYANMSASFSAERIFDAHRHWGLRFADPLLVNQPSFANDRQPQRPLRVGYVSGDLRRHSVAAFLQPLLQHHDRDAVGIYLYSNNKRTKDGVTEQLRGLAQEWRDIEKLDDDAVLATIRADAIDVLVDLSGHTGGHRLPVFARRAAPVQMTYLGYIDTTGIQAMDYRISDALADPVGITDPFHTEKLLRLAGGYLCYQPLPVPIEPAPPPSIERGFVTFGSANSIAKVTHEVLALWARIMQAVPGSRLLLKDSRLDMSVVRQQVAAYLGSQGIAADRLDLRVRTATDLAHLQTYNDIDIALDPFPYNGVTTTCEALWMGVPVIALAGSRSASRQGVDILTRVGAGELIAADRDEYVAIATALAQNPSRLAEWRSSLRRRLLESPLCDGARLAREIEAAYRLAWQRWCHEDSSG